jgi:NAD(P)-dependent dehydrogenase (short-subunit alcohol dehydrogenase family)
VHVTDESAQQRVMVTAAAAGIGAVIAARFAAQGARVQVCDVDAKALTRQRDHHPGIVGTQVDLADGSAVTQWCHEAIDALGGVDVLVNNAGVAGPTAFVEDVEPDEWRHCLTVGLDSHYLTCRAVTPVMKRQGSGSIVNISSTAGQYGYGQRSPYAAAKWAVIGLTKSLAIELGPHNVRANAICPGSVTGERMKRVIAAQAAARDVPDAVVEQEYTSSQSIRRFVDPSEIADMCLFLASPQAAMVNGQAIAVDGNTETYHL